ADPKLDPAALAAHVVRELGERRVQPVARRVDRDEFLVEEVAERRGLARRYLLLHAEGAAGDENRLAARQRGPRAGAHDLAGGQRYRGLPRTVGGVEHARDVEVGAPADPVRRDARVTDVEVGRAVRVRQAAEVGERLAAVGREREPGGLLLV